MNLVSFKNVFLDGIKYSIYILRFNVEKFRLQLFKT
jgi:hypothetical protein